MQLKEFWLISPSLEAKEIFQAIQTVIAPEVIEKALEKSNSFEERKRKLPASLVVCLVTNIEFISKINKFFELINNNKSYFIF